MTIVPAPCYPAVFPPKIVYVWYHAPTIRSRSGMRCKKDHDHAIQPVPAVSGQMVGH